MADEQVDVNDTKSVGKKLGESILQGFKTVSNGLLTQGKNVSSEMGKTLPGKEMIKEMGRTMLTGGIAAAGSNAAINSGDPTYAITGQRMAQAVDKAIQQHWWINKAKEFEKEKLKPMRSQMEKLKREYDAKTNELQARMYAHDNQFGAEKEAALQANLDDLKAQLDAGKIDQEKYDAEENKIAASITELQSARNSDRDVIMQEYSAAMSTFNNMYTEQVMQLMNEAAMYDQNNPILGQMVNGLAGIAQQEMESITSKLAVGQDASDAMGANEAADVASASRPTISQMQRRNEAATVQQEAAAREQSTMSDEAEAELARAKAPDEEHTGLTRLTEMVTELHRTSRSPGTAIKAAINDNRVIQETQNIYQDDVERFEQALGYVVRDEDGNLAPNEDLVSDEEELAKLRGQMAQFSLSYEAAKAIPGNENMSVSELSDYIDELNIKEQSLNIPTAVTIIQERIAKSGKRPKAKDVREALDQAQSRNPATVEEMISGAVEILGGNESKKKEEKGLWDSAKETAQEGASAVGAAVSGLFKRNQMPPRPQPMNKKEANSEVKSKAQATASKGLGISGGPSSDSSKFFEGRVTPKTLLANVKPNDHGKVYGALVVRKGMLQAHLAELKEDPDKLSEAKAIERELESLEAFVNSYREYAKDNKIVKQEMDQVVKQGKVNDKLLAKYGL